LTTIAGPALVDLRLHHIRVLTDLERQEYDPDHYGQVGEQRESLVQLAGLIHGGPLGERMDDGLGDSVGPPSWVGQ
jgi:hypothetical protein